AEARTAPARRPRNGIRRARTRNVPERLRLRPGAAAVGARCKWASYFPTQRPLSYPSPSRGGLDRAAVRGGGRSHNVDETPPPPPPPGPPPPARGAGGRTTAARTP